MLGLEVVDDCAKVTNRHFVLSFCFVFSLRLLKVGSPVNIENAQPGASPQSAGIMGGPSSAPAPVVPASAPFSAPPAPSSAAPSFASVPPSRPASNYSVVNNPYSSPTRQPMQVPDRLFERFGFATCLDPFPSF